VQEIRTGEADGLTLAEAVARYGLPDFDRDAGRAMCPGAESWTAFMARAAAAIERLAAVHAGRTVVVVTHGGFIDGAFVHFFGLGAARLPPAQLRTRHASLTHWQKRPRWNLTESWHLVTFNDVAHLRDLDRPERIPWAALRTTRA
jgi:probable phosphoglycerate mutase